MSTVIEKGNFYEANGMIYLIGGNVPCIANRWCMKFAYKKVYKVKGKNKVVVGKKIVLYDDDDKIVRNETKEEKELFTYCAVSCIYYMQQKNFKLAKRQDYKFPEEHKEVLTRLFCNDFYRTKERDFPNVDKYLI